MVNTRKKNPSAEDIKILDDYAAMEDFGFTSDNGQEDDLLEEVSSLCDTIDALRSECQDARNRLEQVEKLIMPLLANLLKTADQEIIKWPNRGPQLEKKIDQLLKLTRP